MNAEEKYFTPRRRRLHAALLERSTEVAGLYRGAVRELSRTVAPGEVPSHINLVCHSMREFMGGLPGVFSAEIRKRDGDSDRLLRRLPTLAAKYPDMNLELDQTDVPVPRDLARHLNKLLLAQREIEGRTRANARLLLTGNADLHSKGVSLWLDVWGYFQSHTHWDRGSRTRPLPSDDKLDDKIALVDELMEPRVRPFIEGRPALDEFLRRINGEGSQRD
ncbi:hypothetical protein [Pseudolysinimonas sp.]|uniref:hypothetical protein n=1 Tax=Pseudolysinimonas sp. TaxID=2680009 RepID=UPI003F7D3E8D